MLRHVSSAPWCRRHSRLAVRTDAEHVSLLQTQLTAHYDDSQPQFQPMWDAVTEAVRAHAAAPSAILDLASGSGEPACTLARAFPMASIVASDSSSDERERAARRASSMGLSQRVSVEPIDLSEVHVFARVADEERDSLPQCNVVTCSLGLFMLPPAQHGACLRGIHAILAPGGLLVASVWEDMALIDLGSQSVGTALGRAALPPPYDAATLGGGCADPILASAGLEPTTCGRHNAVHELGLRLGRHGSDACWMLGLMPFLPTLSQLSERNAVPPGVFGRARAAFEQEVETAGYVDADSGDVVVPLRWRLLCARRPL